MFSFQAGEPLGEGFFLCGVKKKSAASMIMSVNVLDSLSHIPPDWTGGQKDWPSPTWPGLSASICWSVIEQDTDSPPAPGCCSAAELALWPRSVREGGLPCGINTGLYYLSEDANGSFIIASLSCVIIAAGSHLHALHVTHIGELYPSLCVYYRCYADDVQLNVSVKPEGFLNNNFTSLSQWD